MKKMSKIVISGVGIYTPPNKISTQELAKTFNDYLVSIQSSENKNNKYFIDPKFVENVIGVENRYVVDKSGILNPNIMHPIIEKRSADQLSLQAEMGVNAAKEAIAKSGKEIQDIQAVIVACTDVERSTPSIAIEIQTNLGIKGFSFHMSVACASALFGLHTACNMIASGTKTVLLVVPEITSALVNFRDRESAFIFGDASAALVIENFDYCTSAEVFEIISTELETMFSNNIRCDFGYLKKYDPEYNYEKKELMHMNGLQVFRDMIDFIPEHIKNHLLKNNLHPKDIKQFWLHQANLKMNRQIARNLFGGDESNIQSRFPMIMNEYANTAAAGCIIALYHHNDLENGEYGLISGFGAGYSVGSAVIQKIR
jgi:beta-ketodecanoyl-[acyl-carrier-protein] synthase